MSNQPKHGGPAFPTENAHQNGSNTYHFEGMTLRDYFAAAAMRGMQANSSIDAKPNITNEKVARWSYEIADAMLAGREKKEAQK
jgi:hypothetical protein